MTDSTTQKQLRRRWVREQARLANLIPDMEKELDRMRAKNINPAVIDEKSRKMDLIIEVMNTADEIINALSFANVQLRLQQEVSDRELMKLLGDRGDLFNQYFTLSQKLREKKQESE